jgi:hypothetical protein
VFGISEAVSKWMRSIRPSVRDKYIERVIKEINIMDLQEYMEHIKTNIKMNITGTTENNKIKAYMELKDITGNTINNIDSFQLTNGFAYYSKELFSTKFGISARTIQRREKEINEMKDYWRYCLRFAGYKNYYSIGLLGVRKKNLTGRTRSEYIQFLQYFDWDIIGSIRPNNAKSIQSVRNLMEGLNKALLKRFPEAKIILWYNIEKNPDCSGYHAHYVLKCSFVNTDTVKKWIVKYLGKYEYSQTGNTLESSIHVDDFKSDGKWLEYITKQIAEMPDGYDLLTN